MVHITDKNQSLDESGIVNKMIKLKR